MDSKGVPDDSGVKEVFITAISAMLFAMNAAAEVFQKDIGDIISNLQSKLNEIGHQ